MDQPKIPTLKDAQKPQVKIKGLAAGLSLLERLKQFKKKDLAFILAGLGTLFMAPLAEHFMMAPEGGDASLRPGMSGGRGGASLFGDGGSPYENLTGLAPGSAIGGGSDVITPLNVRDPSALVMGVGAQQQPPAGSLAPQTPAPGSAKELDLKDAIANAAARGVGAAARRAPVPVPKPGMTGSGLRGLGVVSGGSSAGAGLGPISSSGLSTNKAAASNSLGDVRPASGYRSASGARGPGKGGGGLEALKGAAGGAGDIFNKGGASGALETAASQNIPNGGSGFGGGGAGGSGSADKGPGGGKSDGQKSVGESLEFLRKKQEMEKAIDLKWKMKEKKAMFPIELQQEAAKTALMKGVVEPLAGQFAELVKTTFDKGSKQGLQCKNPDGSWVDVPGGCKDGSIVGRRDGSGKCVQDLNERRECRQVTFPGVPADAKPGDNSPERAPGGTLAGVGQVCTDLAGDFLTRKKEGEDKTPSDTATRDALVKIGGQAASVGLTLSGGTGTGDGLCGGRNYGQVGDAGVIQLQRNAKTALDNALEGTEWGLIGLWNGAGPAGEGLDKALVGAKAVKTKAEVESKFKGVIDLYEGTGVENNFAPMEGKGAKRMLDEANNSLDGKAPRESVTKNLETATALLAKSKAALAALKGAAPEGFSTEVDKVGKLPSNDKAKEIYAKLKTEAATKDAALKKAGIDQTALDKILGAVEGGGTGARAAATLAYKTRDDVKVLIGSGDNATLETLKGISDKVKQLKETAMAPGATDATAATEATNVPAAPGLAGKLKAGAGQADTQLKTVRGLQAESKAVNP